MNSTTDSEKYIIDTTKPIDIINSNNLITIKKAAEILGTTVTTLRRWEKEKRFETVKIPKGPRCVYPKQIEELKKELNYRTLNRKPKTPSCHPDRPYFAKDLCHECYRKMDSGRPENKERQKIYRNTAYKILRQNPDLKARRRINKRKNTIKMFGLTLDQYNDLVKKGCKACETKDWNGKTPHLDHDHSCCPHKKGCPKCFRGLLCDICNLLMGIAKDSSERLSKATNYAKQCELKKLNMPIKDSSNNMI